MAFIKALIRILKLSSSKKKEKREERKVYLIEKNPTQIKKLKEFLKSKKIPKIDETETHSFERTENTLTNQNKFFFIVAICHQTSPIGERRLEGYIDNELKYGWDYLKEKTLTDSSGIIDFSSCRSWANIYPELLSEVYKDEKLGLTLNRINERCSLLNDIGRKFKDFDFRTVHDLYTNCSSLNGENGLLKLLSNFIAYSDPVQKKSLFFLSLMNSVFDWVYKETLSSPVDYHELRGHLRLGTINIKSESLKYKLDKNLPVTEKEDIRLRKTVQSINDNLLKNNNITPSQLHYLLWNIFRNCCPNNGKTHCYDCGSECSLPQKYGQITEYENCVFSEICLSVGKYKVKEPAYIGHYY